MEEVEYLEEYEDLILPIMNSNSAALKSRSNINGDDEDSSSIDQDIFESLFDDRSDDDVPPPKKVDSKLRRNPDERYSLDSLDMLVKDLGEQLSPQSRIAQYKSGTANDKAKHTIKSPRKDTALTQTSPNLDANTAVSSKANTSSQKTDSLVSHHEKSKSDATGRPKSQQAHSQERNLTHKMSQIHDRNVLTSNTSPNSTHNRNKTSLTSSISPSSPLKRVKNALTNNITGSSTRTKSSMSTSNAPKASTSKSMVPRRQFLSETSAITSSVNTQSKTNIAASSKKVNRMHSAIIKSVDPLEDPLSLEHVNSSDGSDCDDIAFSDISTHTYVTLSDVDEEGRHVIDLSNDSSYEKNLENLRGSTPSPTVSDDLSDKEKSTTKSTNQLAENEISVESPKGILNSKLETISKIKVTESEDVVTPDFAVESQEKAIKSSEITSLPSDNLLERIDSLLQTDDKEDLLPAINRNDKNETDTSKNSTEVKENPILLQSTNSTIKVNAIEDKNNSNKTGNEVNSTVDCVTTTATTKVAFKSKNTEPKNKEYVEKQKSVNDTESQHDRKYVAKSDGDVVAGTSSLSNESKKKKEMNSILELNDINKEITQSETKEEGNTEKDDIRPKSSNKNDRAIDRENKKEIKIDSNVSTEAEKRDKNKIDKQGSKRDSIKRIKCNEKCDDSVTSKEIEFDSCKEYKNFDDEKCLDNKNIGKEETINKDSEKVEKNHNNSTMDNKEKIPVKEKKKPVDKNESPKKSDSDKKIEKHMSSDKSKPKINESDEPEDISKKKHDSRTPLKHKDNPKKLIKEKGEKPESSSTNKIDEIKNTETKKNMGKRDINETEKQRYEDNANIQNESIKALDTHNKSCCVNDKQKEKTKNSLGNGEDTNWKNVKKEEKYKEQNCESQEEKLKEKIFKNVKGEEKIKNPALEKTNVKNIKAYKKEEKRSDPFPIENNVKDKDADVGKCAEENLNEHGDNIENNLNESKNNKKHEEELKNAEVEKEKSEKTAEAETSIKEKETRLDLNKKVLKNNPKKKGGDKLMTEKETNAENVNEVKAAEKTSEPEKSTEKKNEHKIKQVEKMNEKNSESGNILKREINESANREEKIDAKASKNSASSSENSESCENIPDKNSPKQREKLRREENVNLSAPVCEAQVTECAEKKEIELSLKESAENLGSSKTDNEDDVNNKNIDSSERSISNDHTPCKVSNKESLDDKQKSELISDEIKEPTGVDTTIAFEKSNSDLDEITTSASITVEEDGKARRSLRKRVIDHSPSNNDQNKKSLKAPTTSGNLKQKEEMRIITSTGRTRARQVIPTAPEKCEKESETLNKRIKLDNMKKYNNKGSEKDIEKSSVIESKNLISKVSDVATKVLQKEKEKQTTMTSAEEEEPPNKVARMDAEESLNPTQIPSKRLRRPKVVDGDCPAPAIDKDKTEPADKIAAIIRGTETKHISTKRKSMRSKGTDDCQSEINKTVEDMSKYQTQPFGDKFPSADVVKEGKNVSKDISVKNNSFGKKDNKTFPSKLDRESNVITFSEWLQQKKDDGEGQSTERGENIIENSVLTCHSKKSHNNKNSSNNTTSAKRNNASMGQAMQKQANSVQNRKDVKAATEKPDSSNPRTRTEKSFAATRTGRANVTTGGFKKPTAPQKLPTSPTRSAVSTPALSAVSVNKSKYFHETVSGREKNLRSYSYGGKIFKLRKLHIRINRSVVPSYFKKIQETTKRNASKPITDRKEPVPKATSVSVAMSKSDTSVKQKHNSSVDKAKAKITQKRVSLKTNAVPSSYGRQLVSGPLSIMTIPPDRRRMPPLMAEEARGIGGSTQEKRDDIPLLKPMKPSEPSGNSSRLQQFPLAQQKQIITKETMREKSNNQMQTQNETTNSTISEETALLFTPVEPKKEVEEEQQLTLLSAEPSNSSSLTSRTLAIAAATNSALSQLCSNETNLFSGLTPTPLDTNGTRLYSYLHPAKYNRNHGCVLLDYCCPNLDGPMPAIDPTRIHAQVHASVRELPAHIVMTTKLITRADLDADKNAIPASIRQKVEKITADTNAANTGLNSNVPSAPVVSTSTLIPPNTVSLTSLSALQKSLPSTTTITPKLVASSSVAPSASLTPITPYSAVANSQSQSSTMSVEHQRQLLRTQVRQFDARLKKYYYSIAVLTFAERQRVIEGIVNSTTISDKEVSYAVRLIDEYISQVNQLTNSSPMSRATRQVTGLNSSQETGATNTQAQYKPTVTINKSAMSTRSSAVSNSASINNLSLSNAAVTNTSSASLKTSAQDSPRIYYAKPPFQTSTPNSSTNVNKAASNTALRSTHRQGRNVAIRRPTPVVAISKRLPPMTRSPQVNTSIASKPVTPESMRLTRKTAAFVITQDDTRGTMDECILPDDHSKAEIKHEEDDGHFIGAS